MPSPMRLPDGSVVQPSTPSYGGLRGPTPVAVFIDETPEVEVSPAPTIPVYGQIPSYGTYQPVVVSPEEFEATRPIPTPFLTPEQEAEVIAALEPDPDVPQASDPTEKVVAGSVSKTFLTGSEHGVDWNWEQIRDFVVDGIEQHTGSFPRNPLTEAGIFKSFKSRWGDMAGPIAIYAINTAGGWWENAPISVNRFCKGSDPYFAQVIIKRVESALALQS